ncbi:unnamed protein product, partial [Rotaria sp. Silwood2]
MVVVEYAHCRKWNYPFTNTQELFGYDIRLPDVCIFTHTLASSNQLHLLSAPELNRGG